MGHAESKTFDSRHSQISDAVIERQFTDSYLASLYDLSFPPKERDDFRFYLPMIMAARSVLDVGCGTGALLRWAREAGHTGRLCGLDPGEGMLDQARRCTDVEWIFGDLSSVRWDCEFDLVVMTGHAFQELRTDDEIRGALSAIRTALVRGGRFAFETRNPLDRAWERWGGQYSGDVVDASGALVHRQYRVELPVDGDVVRGVQTYTSPEWDRPRITHGALRFMSKPSLETFLSDAALTIEEQYGDWDRSRFTPSSPEIITIARR